MNEHEYALFVLQLSAIGQVQTAFEQLDTDELNNLMWLLRRAVSAAERERLRRQGKEPC